MLGKNHQKWLLKGIRTASKTINEMLITENNMALTVSPSSKKSIAVSIPACIPKWTHISHSHEFSITIQFVFLHNDFMERPKQVIPHNLWLVCLYANVATSVPHFSWWLSMMSATPRWREDSKNWFQTIVCLVCLHKYSKNGSSLFMEAETWCQHHHTDPQSAALTLPLWCQHLVFAMIHAVPTLLAVSFATFSRKLAPENPLTLIFYFNELATQKPVSAGKFGKWQQFPSLPHQSIVRFNWGRCANLYKTTWIVSQV